jgi:hypothetical protein
MIILYTGLPRQGKTLNLAWDVARLLKYGRRVITNTPIWTFIKGRKVVADFYPDADRFTYELLHANNATVVIDEISLVFSSLRWSKLGLDMFAKFRQAGKQSCDLYGTSQAYVDTVSALRRVVDTVTVCTKGYFLIPFPIRLQWDSYIKERGIYVRQGPVLHMPMVYHMKTVSKGYFTSKAELPENRRRYIYRERTLYPSQFKRASTYYDHSYLIKFSLVGRLANFGQAKSFDEMKREEENGKVRKYTKKAIPSIVEVIQSHTIDQKGKEVPNVHY